MTARKTKAVLDAEEVGIPVDEDTTAPVKAARKPRTPKPVTDLPTANAAFQKAKEKAARANARATEASEDAERANEAVTEAAKVLKGYMDEVDSALSSALPQSSEDLSGPYGEEGPVELPYEGDGHGDTAHVV